MIIWSEWHIVKCLTGRAGSLSANALKLLDKSEDRKWHELGETWPKVNTLRPRQNDRRFAHDISKTFPDHEPILKLRDFEQF